MNERIRLLADQVDENLSNVIRNDEWLQKFAELIVEEAARVAGRDVGHFVLEHFGVEE